VKLLFRVLRFLGSFRLLLALSIVLNTLFSVLSTVTIVVIQPILEALFNPGTQQTQQTVLPAAATGISYRLKEWFFGTVSDLVYTPDHSQTLLRLGILIIALFMLKNLIKYLGSNVNTRLGENVIKSIRDLLFARLIGLSMNHFNNSRVGDIMSLVINDVGVMNGSVSPVFYTLFRQPIEIALFLAVLLAYSPYLTLIAFSTSIASLLLIRFTTKAVRKYALDMQNAMGNVTSVLQEMIAGIRVVKTISAEDIAAKKFSSETYRYVRAAIKNQKIVDLLPAINEVLAITALCAVLYVGGNQVYSGELKAQELMTFLFALFSIMSPIAQLTGTPTTVQRGLVAAERIFGIIDSQPSVQDGNASVPPLQQAITVQDMDFAYQSGRTVLKNVNLIVPKGKKIALVGQSGSGKSTMIDLCMRLYDPVKGSILFDGKDIRQFSLADYRSHFGIVSQEPFLFHDTIAANIAFGMPGISRSQIEEAAKAANAHQFIMNLPQGYDTPVGDRGVLLSGGQKQRIAIARALARKPEILIFDEATSALDAESERLVQEAIARLLHGRTAIIIAHRLSTIADADCIYVFDNGQIAEYGDHHSLIKAGGIYARLCQLQSLPNANSH
jgi:subfamily B ATP-binding cassette protein MsbA